MKSTFESETVLTELMIPSYANFGGKVHGGILLSLMDKVAYVTAAKHCSGYVVTVSVEGVEFLSPIEVGDLVSLKARVNYVGKTSMIVGIRVEALNPKTGVVRHTNSCYFTMVAKDEHGKPTEVPGLLITDEESLRRFAEGKALKSLAKQTHQLLKEEFHKMPISEIKKSIEGERGEIQNN
ncbi:MAG: acyl-CoA thioesterase, partial [Flavobacteriia bacterium]